MFEFVVVFLKLTVIVILVFEVGQCSALFDFPLVKFAANSLGLVSYVLELVSVPLHIDLQSSHLYGVVLFVLV